MSSSKFVIKSTQQFGSEEKEVYWSGAYWGDKEDAASYSKYGAKEQAARLADIYLELTLLVVPLA